jgi:hypothetical protein
MSSFFKKISTFILIFILLSGMATPVRAQEDTPFVLRLSRNFGYSSGTGKIQGNFTIKVSGPQDLSRVVFYINDEVMGEVNQAPLELNFHTGNYPVGVYTLRAIGYTSGGRELHSNEQKREFVSAQEGLQTAGKIIIPLFCYHSAVYAGLIRVSLAHRQKKSGTTRSSTQLRSPGRHNLPEVQPAFRDAHLGIEPVGRQARPLPSLRQMEPGTAHHRGCFTRGGTRRAGDSRGEHPGYSRCGREAATRP